MANIDLPLSISFQTEGVTPISDIIQSLQATETAIQDAVSILPSLIDGLHIESEKVFVRSLSQESPLRELFLVSLIIAFQDDLKTEVPPMLETIFKTDIPDSYDTILTIVTMTVLFYGAGFLKDAAVNAVSDGKLRAQVSKLIAQLSISTGKTEDEIIAIFDAKYGSPTTV